MPGAPRYPDAEIATFRRLASGEARDVDDLVQRFRAATGRPVTRAVCDSLLKRIGLNAADVIRANGASAGVPPPAPPVVPVEPPAAPPVEWSGARPASTGAGLERRLLIGDLHVPFHHVPSCAAVIALAKAIQPHVVIQLGDLFNMGAVSHHPRPFGGRENHADATIQGLSFLDALGRAAPGARKIVLLGNHDEWGEQYEDEHPEFGGLFAAKSMGLDRLGWEIVPRRRQPYVLGPVAYLHGYGGGEHAAKKYVIEVCPQVGVRQVKAAHHHNVQRYHGKNGCEGWIAGWLGRPECPAFDYAKNRDHWERSVLVEDILGDHVTTTPVVLRNGAALFGGRLITQAAA